MHAIRVNIINQSTNPVPAYATEGASGMDLRANLDQPLVLRPMERFLVPTGISIEIPAGYEAQVRPRSGLAIKQGHHLPEQSRNDRQRLSGRNKGHPH